MQARRAKVGEILKEFLQKTKVAAMLESKQNEQAEATRVAEMQKILEDMEKEIDSALKKEIHCRWDELLAAEELARLAERVYFGLADEKLGRDMANSLLPLFLELEVDVNFARVDGV